MLLLCFGSYTIQEIQFPVNATSILYMCWVICPKVQFEAFVQKLQAEKNGVEMAYKITYFYRECMQFLMGMYKLLKNCKHSKLKLHGPPPPHYKFHAHLPPLKLLTYVIFSTCTYDKWLINLIFMHKIAEFFIFPKLPYLFCRFARVINDQVGLDAATPQFRLLSAHLEFSRRIRFVPTQFVVRVGR